MHENEFEDTDDYVDICANVDTLVLDSILDNPKYSHIPIDELELAIAQWWDSLTPEEKGEPKGKTEIKARATFLPSNFSLPRHLKEKPTHLEM